jgi:hypothetical protein
MENLKKFWPLILGVVLFGLAVKHRQRMATAIDADQIQADAAGMAAHSSLVTGPPAVPKPDPAPTPGGNSPIRLVPKVSLAVFEHDVPAVKAASNDHVAGARKMIPPLTKGVDQARTLAAKPIIDVSKHIKPDAVKAMFAVTPKPVLKTAVARPTVKYQYTPGATPSSSPLTPPRVAPGTYYYSQPRLFRR